MSEAAAERALAPGEPDLPGPFAVGRYANELRDYLRGRSKVRLIGEVTNFRGLRPKAIYFELRDEGGAVPCSMWRSDFDRLELPEDALRDGVEIVAAGGVDYFPGNATSSPSFSFRVTYLRPAGEGDLLAQLARRRRELAADGVFEPQKRLRPARIPRAIGVVTGADSAAQADILAGLRRRSWGGRVVFAHPPVQGRAAAPRIAAALRDLAAIEEIETIVVARGGGSLADLWCFCDEDLCRTISLLRVPVIAAVGHEIDRTLIDDVAAISCSTPTHAVESAVPLDVAIARAEVGVKAAGLSRFGTRAVGERAGTLGRRARSLSQHARGQRARLHQTLREIRAAGRRSLAVRSERLGRFGVVLRRRSEATEVAIDGGRSGLRRRAGSVERHSGTLVSRRAAGLERLAATLAAHDPDRVLERGYSIVSDRDGDVVTSAAAARRARELRVRFADDHVDAKVEEQ